MQPYLSMPGRHKYRSCIFTYTQLVQVDLHIINKHINTFVHVIMLIKQYFFIEYLFREVSAAIPKQNAVYLLKFPELSNPIHCLHNQG